MGRVSFQLTRDISIVADFTLGDKTPIRYDL